MDTRGTFLKEDGRQFINSEEIEASFTSVAQSLIETGTLAEYIEALFDDIDGLDSDDRTRLTGVIIDELAYCLTRFQVNDRAAISEEQMQGLRQAVENCFENNRGV